ncbi:MAG: hypothetical protein MRY83_22190 [Flavobacteriales bacterium]|nr:hypothetical protein [Flavobacteriales bacterium]
MDKIYNHSFLEFRNQQLGDIEKIEFELGKLSLRKMNIETRSQLYQYRCQLSLIKRNCLELDRKEALVPMGSRIKEFQLRSADFIAVAYKYSKDE